VVVFDEAENKTYEAVVSITGNAVRSWEHIPGVQPEVMVDEFEDAERAVKARLPARATRSVSLRAGARG
jgi:primary-amine oxidase